MALKDKMMSYITEEEISEMIKNLAREIEMDYAGEEILLVCPLKGSAFFVADLMR